MTPIPGIEEYFATEGGKIWTTRPRNGKAGDITVREVRGTTDKNGYQVIGFKTKPAKRFVHQLVLETFVGPRKPGQGSRHLDGDSQNNRLENLEWSDQKTNMRDKVAHGTDNRGSNHVSSKITEEQVVEIRKIYSEKKISHSKIAKLYGVSTSTIQRIINNKRWQHV